jgi:hypothetical protein
MGLGVRDDADFSGTKPVEERHRINEANLAEWMSSHVEGFAGPLTVSQFKGGQSDPTYRLDTPQDVLCDAAQAVQPNFCRRLMPLIANSR